MQAMLTLNLKFWRRAARKCALFEFLKSQVDATPLLGCHFFQSLRCQIFMSDSTYKLSQYGASVKTASETAVGFAA